MKNYLAFASVIILSLFIGCIDEINLNVDTENRTLVVDGFVSDLKGNFQLKLSKSSVIGIGNDNVLNPVPGAKVQLLDASGGIYPYQESEDGIYELTSFEAQREKEYFIDIILTDGRHYQSSPAKLRSSSLISSVSYEVNEVTFRNNIGAFVTEDIISMKLQSDISNSGTPPYLRWRVEGEFAVSENYPNALSPRTCYAKTNLDINDIRIVDATTLPDGKLFDQVIAETEYNSRFAEQFCFHIFQFSISEEEFNYWKNIKEIIDINGGLFDPPPGTLIGNIRNIDNPDDIAVGYFSVASASFSRQFVNGSDIGKVLRPLCTNNFRANNPFGCTDCTKIRDSSLERPSYWEF